MTNLEMLLAGTKEGVLKRGDLMVLRSLLSVYASTWLSRGDSLAKAWKLNEISTTILNAPPYIFPVC